MCFAPQQRALSGHLNYQKCSEPTIINSFDTLKRTTPWTFWTVCFAPFDFKMCFAPQQRALFRHPNFQKHSEAEAFCAFLLGDALRATMPCTFWISQLPKMLRHWSVLRIFTLIWPDGSAPAALASLLFEPPEPQNTGKNTVLRDFSFRAPWACFYWLFLFWLFLLALTLLTSAFPSVHIVGSLTSKLPSVRTVKPFAIHIYIYICVYTYIGV